MTASDDNDNHDDIEIIDAPPPLSTDAADGSSSETSPQAPADDPFSPDFPGRDPFPPFVPPPEAESIGMAEDPPDDNDNDDGIGLMSGMGQHLDELRKRLIISLAVFAPLFIVGMLLYQTLWNIIIKPLERAGPHLLRFQALGPSDGLIMAMRIAFAFALFLSLPVWLSQIWNFVAPGLTGRERRLLYLSLGSGTVLFLIGAAMAYFAGVPLALEFLLPFNQSLSGWENAFTGSGYVDFVITCCAGFGIAFELPLVMTALALAGIITPKGVREWWRVIILAVVVCAAVMTPPDPFSQLMLAIPMVILFGIGYIMVRWAARRAEANE